MWLLNQLILTFFLLKIEQTVQEKVDTKKKEDCELKRRLKEKELEKSVKEDQWKKEKLRRETEDRMWDVSSGSLSQGEKSKHDGKKVLENDSKVSLSKLEETILKVQQQMAEGTDHVNFELKMKEQDKHKEQDKYKEQEKYKEQDEASVPVEPRRSRT